MKPEFGDTVTVFNKLIRKEKPNREKYFWWDKFWQEKDTEPVSGIFLGWRTLSNGRRYTDMTYKATEHLRVALVCTNQNKNPFYTTDFEPQE